MNPSTDPGLRPRLWLLFTAVAALSACGGAGSDAPAPAPPAGGPTDAQRSQAATATAQSPSNACAGVAPFYWEIGDRDGSKASGSVAAAGSATRYDASSAMAIASASKWFYAAVVAEKRAGNLNAEDIKFLNFRSGYDNFIGCAGGQTIDACLATPAANGSYTATSDGKFAYGGGHMQKHASAAMGYGAMDNAALAAEYRAQLGTDLALAFSQPQPAGAMQTTPADYALFLRKLLAGGLRLAPLLGAQAVCTNPATCSAALFAPIPANESWLYSLGHWVESDPVVGDGAFSSPGAFGFYPWIDATKAWYGLLARQVSNGATASAQCGRLIRKAWVAGTAQ